MLPFCSDAGAPPQIRPTGRASGVARKWRLGTKIEGEAQIEGEARDLEGRGVWGGGSVSPSPENFRKFVLETVQSGV